MNIYIGRFVDTYPDGTDLQIIAGYQSEADLSKACLEPRYADNGIPR